MAASRDSDEGTAMRGTAAVATNAGAGTQGLARLRLGDNSPRGELQSRVPASADVVRVAGDEREGRRS